MLTNLQQAHGKAIHEIREIRLKTFRVFRVIRGSFVFLIRRFYLVDLNEEVRRHSHWWRT